MKKRVLSALLVLCMACSMVSTVWAANEQATPETATEPQSAPVEVTIATPENAMADNQSFEATDPDSGVIVQAEAPEGALPDGAQMSVALLGASTDAGADETLATVAEELNNADVAYEGFVALEISFTDANGAKVEPSQPVSVSFSLPANVLPEDVDADTLAVQHLAENEVGEVVSVDTVADAAEETEGTISIESAPMAMAEVDAVAETVTAEFEVDGFSSFVITWQGSDSWWRKFNAHAAYMDADGDIHEIDGRFTFPTVNQENVSLRDAVNVSNINVPDVTSYSGTTYFYANEVYIQSRYSDPVRVYYLRYDDGYTGGWQYLATNAWSDNDNEWRDFPDNETVYFIFKESDQTASDDLRSIDTLDTGDTIQISLYNYTTADEEDGINQNGLSGNFNFGDGIAGGIDRGNEGWNSWSSGRGSYQGIVESILSEVQEDGVTYTYPLFRDDINSGKSLAYLFSASDDVEAKTGLNHLFKDDDGYYLFDSGTNFASIVAVDGTNTAEDKDFVVYEKPYLGGGTGSQQAKFAPFNTLTSYNTYNGIVDYYFGMRISFDFWQPENGQINGEDMVFEFSGDDDVWIFIDDVLVLDIGGIHDEMSGSINFATGDVEMYYDSNGNTVHTTLKALLQAVGVATDSEDWDGNTFNDRTQHSFDLFYLERGAGGSNCRIRFNMPPVPTNSLLVQKDVSADSADAKYFLGNFEYQFQVVDESGDSLLKNGDPYQVYDATTNTFIRNDTVGENGVFTLKDGEQARFTAAIDEQGDPIRYGFLLQTSNEKYYVQELLEEDYVTQYGNVQLTVSNDGGSIETDYNEENSGDSGSGELEEFTTCKSNPMQGSDGTNYVVFDNTIDTEKLSTLRIRKELMPGTQVDANETFDIEVKINGQSLPAGTEYRIEGAESNSTVGSDGAISLQAGQEAVILVKLVAGSSFTVQETNGQNYIVTYSGQVGTVSNDEIAWTDGSFLDTSVTPVKGTVDGVGQTLRVTVNNSDYDFYTSIQLNKTLGNYESEDGSFTFDFDVEQVNSTGTAQPANDNIIVRDASVTIDSSSDANSTREDIYFGFKSSIDDGLYYFKVNEETGAEENVRYDSNYYIVTVTVANKSANVTKVQKFTAEGNAIVGSYTDLTFNNQIAAESATLTLQKTFVGLTDEDVYFLLFGQYKLPVGPNDKDLEDYYEANFSFDVNFCDTAMKDNGESDDHWMVVGEEGKSNISLDEFTKPGTDDEVTTGDHFKVYAARCLNRDGVTAENLEDASNEPMGATLEKVNGNWVYTQKITIPTTPEDTATDGTSGYRYFYTVYELHGEVPGYAKLDPDSAVYTVQLNEKNDGIYEHTWTGLGKFVQANADYTNIDRANALVNMTDEDEQNGIANNELARLHIMGDTTISFSNYYTDSLSIQKDVTLDNDETADTAELFTELGDKEYTIKIEPADESKLVTSSSTEEKDKLGPDWASKLAGTEITVVREGTTQHYETVTFNEDGEIILKLYRGEKVTLKGIPAINYRITEITPEGEDNTFYDTTNYYLADTYFTEKYDGKVDNGPRDDQYDVGDDYTKPEKDNQGPDHWNQYDADDPYGYSDANGVAKTQDGIVSVDVEMGSTGTSVDVTLTNDYEHFKTVTITKQVGGELGAKDAAFDFTTNVARNNSGISYNNDISSSTVIESTMNLVNGTESVGSITVTNSRTEEGAMNSDGYQLSHDDVLTIGKLKKGDMITITETDANQNGYDTTYAINGVAGKTPYESNITVTLNEAILAAAGDDNEIPVVVYNDHPIVTPTGLESNHTTPYVLMITAAGMAGLALIGGIVARRVRRRREE